MTLRWLAERLDRACIELVIRPTLPVLSEASPLSRLRLAEERTENPLTDEVLFQELPAPKSTATRVRTVSGVLRRLTVNWDCPTLQLDEAWFPGVQRELQVRSNWYLRGSPRPLVALLGGWTPFASLGASFMWPLMQLDRAGYDVVILSWLAESGNLFKHSPNKIPSRDPSRNIIELVRATTIVGQLLMLTRDLGHTSVAVWGTSLGAHLVALLATRRVPVHANLYLLEKPLCRLSDPIRFHGRGANTQRHAIANRLDRVYRCVSPLDRPLQVNAKDILIVGGQYDQITPAPGAKQLAEHWNVPIERIAASHVFDLHRTRRVLEILRRLRTTVSPGPPHPD